MRSAGRRYVATVMTPLNGQVDFISSNLESLLVYLEKYRIVEMCIESDEQLENTRMAAAYF